MPLVLGIGRMRELLAERVVGVGERAHHWRMSGDVQAVEAVTILRRVECEGEGGSIVQIRFAEHRAHGIGHDSRCTGTPVDEPRTPPVERFIESLETCQIRLPALPARELDDLILFERTLPDRIDEIRIELAHFLDHPADDATRFGRRVTSRGHAAQPVQGDTADRVDHRRMAGDRDDITCRLDRLLLGLLGHASAESLRCRSGRRQRSERIAEVRGTSSRVSSA